MEHNPIKQRIVGAVILISLAVIALPMIFSESGEREISGSNIPEKPEYLVKTEIIPLDINPLPGPEDTVQHQVIEVRQEQSEEESSAKPEQEDGAVVESKQAEGSEPIPSDPADNQTIVERAKAPIEPRKPAPVAVVSGWVVQVGSFGSESNAFGLRDKLRANGFTTFVERVEGSKVAFRVRVGPELKKERADVIKQRLKAEMQLDGLVMRHH